jgi:hypothetical protein
MYHVLNRPAGDGRAVRRRAKGEQLERVSGLLAESQGQNLAMTVSCVPHP